MQAVIDVCTPSPTTKRSRTDKAKGADEMEQEEEFEYSELSPLRQAIHESRADAGMPTGSGFLCFYLCFLSNFFEPEKKIFQQASAQGPT